MRAMFFRLALRPRRCQCYRKPEGFFCLRAAWRRVKVQETAAQSRAATTKEPVMCGEIFSSKFTPEQKAAPSLAKPNPLARPGRWSVGFDVAKGRGLGGGVERAAFEPTAGYATRAEAERAITVFGGPAFFVIPPSESFGDHDPTMLSREQLERLARAILNNDQAAFEALRPELAKASLAVPAPAPRPRAEVADAIVAWLTDETGDDGNQGLYVDVDDEESYGDGIGAGEDSYDAIKALVIEYQAAAEVPSPADAVVAFLTENCSPGDFQGENNCVHPDDSDTVEYTFDAEDSAELRRLVLAAKA